MLPNHFKSAFAFRTFIFSAIRGEFKNRFARSKIGTLWHFLNPLAMAATYGFVLSQVLAAKLGGVDDVKGAYAIYLIAGIAAWGLFAEILNRCMNIFIEYGATLKKIAFPRVALPLIGLGSSLLGHGLLLLAAFLVFLFMGNWPSLVWLLLPVGALVAIFLSLGLGVLLGTFNVFARDIGQVMGIVITFWFWMTPIVYPKEMLSGVALTIVEWNPVTPLTEFYQDLLLYHRMPDFLSLLYPLAIGVFFMLLALFVFRRASSEIVDEL